MNINAPVLAIDYGEKRFGIAISDSKGIIASPLTVIEVPKRDGIEYVISRIEELIQENNVKTILLGMPQIFQDSYQKSAEKVKKFKDELSKLITIPIIFQDESYSTTRAQNMLTSLGQSTKKSKGKIDKVSAAVFLQEFLNSEQQNNEKHH